MEKKAGGWLTKRGPDEENETRNKLKWGIMDVLEEELIRADLAGTDIDDLFYSFKIETRRTD